MTLMSIVMLLALQGLGGLSRAATSTQSRVYTLADARTAVETIARDLRAANPIEAVSPATLYNTQLSFSIYCDDPGVGDCGTGRLRRVSYRVEGNALIREVGGQDRILMGPSPGASGPEAERAGAVLNSTSRPLFSYFDANDAEISPAGGGTAYRDCTKTVEITLVAVAEPGDLSHPIELVNRVDLRNFYEVTGC